MGDQKPQCQTCQTFHWPLCFRCRNEVTDSLKFISDSCCSALRCAKCQIKYIKRESRKHKSKYFEPTPADDYWPAEYFTDLSSLTNTSTKRHRSRSLSDQDYLIDQTWSPSVI